MAQSVLLRTSERTTFVRCRWQWWQYYVECIRPKVDAQPLRFGSLVHRALELYYKPGIKRGPHPATTFEMLYEQELETLPRMSVREDDDWHSAGELGVALLNAYVDHYGADDEWRVIHSEMTFRVRIEKGLVYVGTVDGVWQSRRTKEIVLAEHKTAAQIWADHLPLDEQASSYWAFSIPALRSRGILKPEQDIKGILYNFIRKGMPDDRPKNELGQSLNKDGSVSKKQPSPIFVRPPIVYRDEYDRKQVRARVLAQFHEMQEIRAGRMSLYKSPSTQNCRGCAFRDPCELHEVGADYRPLIKGAYVKYNPYDAHLINEEGK